MQRRRPRRLLTGPVVDRRRLLQHRFRLQGSRAPRRGHRRQRIPRRNRPQRCPLYGPVPSPGPRCHRGGARPTRTGPRGETPAADGKTTNVLGHARQTNRVRSGKELVNHVGVGGIGVMHQGASFRSSPGARIAAKYVTDLSCISLPPTAASTGSSRGGFSLMSHQPSDPSEMLALLRYSPSPGSHAVSTVEFVKIGCRWG